MFASDLVFVSFREGNNPADEGQITYSALLKQVCKFANVLKANGESLIDII